MTLFNKDRTACLFVRGLSRELRDSFKAWCARRGKNMKDAVVDFMKDCIKEDHIVPKERKRRTNG